MGLPVLWQSNNQSVWTGMINNVNSFLHWGPLTFIKAEGRKYSLIYKTGSVIQGHLIQLPSATKRLSPNHPGRLHLELGCSRSHLALQDRQLKDTGASSFHRGSSALSPSSTYIPSTS